MHPTVPFVFAVLAMVLGLPTRGGAQIVRGPVRYLFVEPRPTVVRPAAVALASPARQVLVRVRTNPAPHVARDHGPPADEDAPRWFVGAGAGALLRFDGLGRDAAPSYRLDLGLALGGAEFGLRFDLAPGFQTGDEPAAFYTAGAAFGYRFLQRSRLHPLVGLGLESVFFNPRGATAVRGVALTGRLGLEMDAPTMFGAVSVGLDLRGHQPLAGAAPTQATLLGVGAHFALRFD